MMTKTKAVSYILGVCLLLVLVGMLTTDYDSMAYSLMIICHVFLTEVFRDMRFEKLLHTSLVVGAFITCIVLITAPLGVAFYLAAFDILFMIYSLHKEEML